MHRTCIILRKWITFICDLNKQGVILHSQLYMVISIAHSEIYNYATYLARYRVFFESVDRLEVPPRRASSVENKLGIIYNLNKIFPNAPKYCIFNFRKVHKKDER